MGLLDKFKSSSNKRDRNTLTGAPDANAATVSSITGAPQPQPEPTERKKSLYAKYQERKRGPGTSQLSDEELRKYTGMKREEMEKFSATAPGVGGGQAAGWITAGGTGGIGLTGTGEGMGGWGREGSKDPVISSQYHDFGSSIRRRKLQSQDRHQKDRDGTISLSKARPAKERNGRSPRTIIMMTERNFT